MPGLLAHARRQPLRRINAFFTTSHSHSNAVAFPWRALSGARHGPALPAGHQFVGHNPADQSAAEVDLSFPSCCRHLGVWQHPDRGRSRSIARFPLRGGHAHPVAKVSVLVWSTVWSLEGRKGPNGNRVPRASAPRLAPAGRGQRRNGIASAVSSPSSATRYHCI
jgi:hypothetical protein